MRLLLALAVLAASIGSAHAEPDYRALNESAVKQHIQPRFAALDAATQRLAAAAEKSCTDTAALRTAWIQAMIAWQGVQHLRFGPALYFNRHQRFAFWPDPRNVVPRQMAELFQSGTLPNFITGSIAPQGLTAIERVLFDQAEAAKLAAEPFRCTWLKAATANLAEMAKAINTDWSEGRQYPKEFVAAKGEVVPYNAPEEATLDLFKALYAAVELPADHKLGRPLGKTAKEQRPQMAEHWRSKQSGAAVAADIAAAKDLFAVVAPQVADKALVADVTKRLDDIVQRTARLELDAMLADPSKRQTLDKLRADMMALKTLMADKLAPALGIPVGFNALDGD